MRGGLAEVSESVDRVERGLAPRLLFHGLLLATAVGLFLGASFAFPSVVHPMCIEGGAYSGFPVAYGFSVEARSFPAMASQSIRPS